MTNDLLTQRLEAATYSGEPFQGSPADFVACYLAGQQLRQAAARFMALDGEPPVRGERFVADTTGAITGAAVVPIMFDYVRRHSIAMQVATVVQMTAPKMNVSTWGIPTISYPNEGVTPPQAVMPVASTIQMVAKTAVLWTGISSELMEDWGGPMDRDAIAQLGLSFMGYVTDEIDRVYLEGDTAATPTPDPFDGVIKLAGKTATVAATPDINVLPGAAFSTLVWILSTAAANTMIPAASNAAPPVGASLEDLASRPTVAGLIWGRPVVIVHTDWLDAVKGVVGALKRATVVGLRTGPEFEFTNEVPEAWVSASYAIRVMVRYAIGVVQPDLICKLT